MSRGWVCPGIRDTVMGDDDRGLFEAYKMLPKPTLPDPNA